jgi:phosphoribosyl 1,2-cyclic phosphodiesterase
LRSAILVDKKILIDAGPDIAKELRSSQIEALEIVLITHDHQDHIGGVKDLLRVRRDLRIVRLRPGQHFKLLGVDIYAFKVKHSNVIPTVGVELGSVLYLPDTADLDSASKYLRESKVAILDGSVLGRSFGGHLAIDEIIGETKVMKNLKKIYFTHNGHTHKTHKEMEKLVQSMGDSRYHIAYDGLEIEV